MILTELALVAVLMGAVLVSAACAASETAVFSLTSSERSRLRRESPGVGRKVESLLSRPRGFLLCVLLLTNIANVVYFVVGWMLERRFTSHTLGVILNIVLVLLLIVAADLLPKLLARARRVAFARVFATPLVAVREAVSPLTRAMELAFVEPMLRLIRPSRPQEARMLSTEELDALLDLSARAGVLAVDEQRLLGDVVELGSTRVREVMTPRVAMAWLEENAAPAKVRDVARISGLPVIPVFRGSLDGPPVGMLELRRYLPAAESGAVRVSDFLLSALFIPERARLDQAMSQLARQDVALCVDEFGAVVGLVGIADVVGRLLTRGGEAAAGDDEGIRRIGPDRWVVPGRLPVRELAAYFLEDADYGRVVGRASTVGGLFFARLGRVPRAGDVVRLGNVALGVESMSGRQVVRVSVSRETAA